MTSQSASSPANFIVRERERAGNNTALSCGMVLGLLARRDGMRVEVHFRLRNFKMESVSRPTTTDSSKHCQELGERLDILRRNENFCDVTITVKGKELKAPRAVLGAASPFFLTLLTSDMKESNEKLIRIELEEATESVMEDVLKYIYTGNVLVTEERAHNLIATANYLLLPSLKTVVGNFLNEIVTVENCVFNYYFADRYQCVELKKKCCKVINSNFSVVMETDYFLNLDVKQVMEWVSSDDITVNTEEEVFKGIVKWVSYNKSEREGDFPDLLHQVRLTSLSHDFLLNELVKEELITKNAEFCLNFVINGVKLVLSATDEEQVTQQPRKCLETHTDAIFVCGGRKALCYLPKQNMWYRLADTLSNHENESLTQWNSKIYIGGPECKEGKSQVMEYYIPTSNTWGTVQTGIFETRKITHCTVLKGHLYAAEFSSGMGRIYRCDTEMNHWVEIQALSTKQENPCVVTDKQFLYVIGGYTGNFNALSRTTRFDPSNDKWEEVAALICGRFQAFGAAMNDKVFIAGGFTSSSMFTSSCEVYNPSTNEWQLMPDLRECRLFASMVCFEGRLYVLGGATYNQHRLPVKVLTVEMFDSEGKKWTIVSAIPVRIFETEEEEEQEKKFQACFARLHKGVIDNLKPLN